MKILVCVKEVPEFDPEAVIRVDESINWVQTDRSSKFIMNRFDEYAVEEAILMKETDSNCSIDIITVGPERAAMVVRRALGMGADNGIHIVSDTQGYLSPFFIANWISTYARDKGYDLILTGVMSEDAMQGQVGPMIAEYLSMPCATAVVKKEVAPDTDVVKVEREIEGGLRDILEVEYPCLLTIQTGINQPRYPVLSSMLRAKKAKLETILSSELDQLDVKQEVIQAGYPQKIRAGDVLEGSQEEKAVKLLKILHDRSLIQ